MLVMMMGFVALSFDVGNLYHVRTEIQSGVDAAALAGASALDGTAAGGTAAIARAVAYGQKQHVYKNDNMPLADSNVVLGTWNFDNNTFTAGTADWTQVNAVQVNYTEPSVSLPFAAVVGKTSLPVTTLGAAVGGGPADDACGFPMVVPDCAVEAAAANDTCSVCMQMASAQNDNFGWTSFGNSNGVPAIAAAVQSACFTNGVPNVDANGQCSGACTNKLNLNQGVQINGGNIFNNNPNDPCSLMVQLINRNGASNPQPFTVEVPVVHLDAKGGACTRANINGQSNPIVGFTLIDVYAVYCGNGKNAPWADSQPGYGRPCNAPANRTVFASLHRELNNGSWTCATTPTNDHAGGKNWGVSAEPRLVQ
jgi:Flp pilus assembly protein TadG